MRFYTFLMCGGLIALFSLTLFGCGGGGGGGNQPTPTGQLGDYSIDTVNKEVTYIPPTNLAQPVTSVWANFVSTGTAPVVNNVPFISPKSGTWTLDISSNNTNFLPTAVGTYTMTVFVGTADNLITQLGSSRQVTLSGGSGGGGPPPPPF